MNKVINKVMNRFRRISCKVLGIKLPINIQVEALIKKGLKVGKNLSIQEDVLIDGSHCFLIEIGDDVTLAPRVHILAHDASTKKHIGYSKIGKVIIGNRVFVGANSTILPNVKIGDNTIIGANSIVTKDIPDNVVCVGNPAKVICSIDDYINKNKENIRKYKLIYDSSFRIDLITSEKKNKMTNDLGDNIGYLE